MDTDSDSQQADKVSPLFKYHLIVPTSVIISVNRIYKQGRGYMNRSIRITVYLILLQDHFGQLLF